MNNRVITGAIVAAVMLLVIVPAFIWPLWTLIFITLITFVLAWELHQALNRIFKPLSFPVMIVSSLTLLAPSVTWFIYRNVKAFQGWQFIPATKLPPSNTWQADFLFLLSQGLAIYAFLLMLIIFAVVVFSVLKHGPARIPQSVAAVSAGVYLAFPMAMVTLYLFAVPNGYRWLFIAFFLPWIADVAAYYIGRVFGHKAFFKHVSPRKTLEGALGGILASTLIGGLFFMLFLSSAAEPFHTKGGAFIFGLVTGCLIALAAEFGDLFASGLKRWAGIKDFSHILPGHGGLLDRFDSVLFSLPITMLMTVIYYIS